MFGVWGRGGQDLLGEGAPLLAGVAASVWGLSAHLTRGPVVLVLDQVRGLGALLLEDGMGGLMKSITNWSLGVQSPGLWSSKVSLGDSGRWTWGAFLVSPRSEAGVP